MDTLNFAKDPWSVIASVSCFTVAILWVVWRTSPEGWARHYVSAHNIRAGDMLKTSYGVLKFQHLGGSSRCYYVNDGKRLTKLDKNMVSGPIGKDTELIQHSERGHQSQKWRDARSVFQAQESRSLRYHEQSVLEKLGYTGLWWRW